MRYLLTGVVALFALCIFYACQKEVSVEYGSAAQGTLQSSAGDCLPKTISGSYLVGKALNDTNYIDVTVNVTSAGPYTISTDTLNGYSFKATGTFANTGTTTVRLKGSGTPGVAGNDAFTVSFGASVCLVDVTVLPAGTGAAAYTMDCASIAKFGTYYKDTALDIRHYVNVTVNVTAVGTYSITTNTVNGYFFSASGMFTGTGSQTVKLAGQGKPLAAGTDAFTVTGAGATCNFTNTVTVAAASGCSPNVQGTYTAGTATTTTNKVSITHTYATAGPYTVRTDTVNGYYFGPTSFSATAGLNTITLNAVGTPTIAGSNTFVVNFGDGQTCTFAVTVNGTTPVNTDYFPLTLNSWWTYMEDDGAGTTDTFKITNKGPVTVSGTTYQRFEYTDGSTVLGEDRYRKDASGFYYQWFDTSGSTASGLVFTGSLPFEMLFLKNSLSTNSTWNSDFAVSNSGTPSTLRFKYTCADQSASLTVNGKTYTNLYKIQRIVQFGVSGVFVTVPNSTTETYYYGKGIGLVWYDDGDTPTYKQTLRYFQVF